MKKNDHHQIIVFLQANKYQTLTKIINDHFKVALACIFVCEMPLMHTYMTLSIVGLYRVESLIIATPVYLWIGINKDKKVVTFRR